MKGEQMTIQLEITDQQQAVIDSLSRSRGVSPQQIISQAIDRLVEEEEDVDWRSALLGLEGIWEHRNDLPDFQEIRREMDRNLWEQ